MRKKEIKIRINFPLAYRSVSKVNTTLESLKALAINEGANLYVESIVLDAKGSQYFLREITKKLAEYNILISYN